jgi:hypothetical protein
MPRGMIGRIVHKLFLKSNIIGLEPKKPIIKNKSCQVGTKKRPTPKKRIVSYKN